MLILYYIQPLSRSSKVKKATKSNGTGDTASGSDTKDQVEKGEVNDYFLCQF